MNRGLFVLTLRPESGVNATIALRLLLKYARRLRLTCVAIRCDPPLFQDSAERRVARKGRVAAHDQEYGK
jgi:hypothetical protein